MTAALMLDNRCLVSWRSRPGAFVSLMTLYESNYIRLQHLLGNLRALPAALLSVSTSDNAVHVALEECSRYTTTLAMTYRFSVDGKTVNEPDMQIRIYHDACLVEALRCGDWRRDWNTALLPQVLRRGARAAAEKWARNMMLSKWLEYCIDRDHRFAAP